MKVESGATFTSTWGPTGKLHLWIVITSRFGDPPSVGVVSISTLRTHSDETVVLHPGDHPFITRASSVMYSQLKIVRVRQILDLVREGLGDLREPISENLLALIQDGLKTSPFAVPAIRNRCLTALF